MALYRETSTGFLVEYATNPGAGYTAISSMPTDTIPHKAAWHRDLDAYGQTSAWHPSLDSGAEDPSPLSITISLSNSAHLVSADASGTVTDGYLGASTAITIYRGTVDVTISEGWSIAITPSNCTANVVGNLITVTAMSADTAYVAISASRTGSPTLTGTFSLAKAIKGATGADGANGANGANGNRGSVQIVVTGSAWSDSAAWAGVVAQTGTNPVLADMVTISNGTFSQAKFYAGGGNGTSTYGTWNSVTSYINGNLLVTGTIGANQIAASSITTAKLNFTPVQAGGSAADINANSTTISGGKITTGTLTATQIAATTITADKLVIGGVTATQMGNNSTSKATVDGTAGTFTAMVAGTIYPIPVSLAVASPPPSGSRSAGGTNRVIITISGTAYTNQATDRGFTIYVMRYLSGGWTQVPGASVSILVRNANVSGSYGQCFSIINVDKVVGDTDTVSYCLGVASAGGFSGLSANPYTFTYGITVLDQYK